MKWLRRKHIRNAIYHYHYGHTKNSLHLHKQKAIKWQNILRGSRVLLTSMLPTMHILYIHTKYESWDAHLGDFIPSVHVFIHSFRVYLNRFTFSVVVVVALIRLHAVYFDGNCIQKQAKNTVFVLSFSFTFMHILASKMVDICLNTSRNGDSCKCKERRLCGKWQNYVGRRTQTWGKIEVNARGRVNEREI